MEELEAAAILEEMASGGWSRGQLDETGRDRWYNLGREIIKVRDVPSIILPVLEHKVSFAEAISLVDTERVEQLENVINNWIPDDFVAPEIWPVKKRGIRFNRFDDACMAWLLLAMDYPVLEISKCSTTQIWKVITILMGIEFGNQNNDSGKKVRNHVREVISLGPKTELSEEQSSELNKLVSENRDEKTGTIPLGLHNTIDESTVRKKVWRRKAEG